MNYLLNSRTFIIGDKNYNEPFEIYFYLYCGYFYHKLLGNRIKKYPSDVYYIFTKNINIICISNLSDNFKLFF